MQKLKPILGSFFYAGFLPNAPGTWGSFFALFFIYFLGMYCPWYSVAIFAVVCSFITLWVSEECERVWGGDPSPLVMDEFAGQAVTFTTISFYLTEDLGYNILLLFAGFVFFRFFDIKKPLGVDDLQQLPGRWGILVDDLLAGFYGFICLQAVLFLVG